MFSTGFSPLSIRDLMFYGKRLFNKSTVDSNVDFPQIVIEKGATKRGIQR